MTINLRDVECALTVAEVGGFRAAAQELYLSQPALSQRVANLEAHLGARLFHRLGREIALTPAGEAFLAPARQALRHGELVEAAVADVAGLRSGTLDLVSLPSITITHLAALISEFRGSHPGVQVRVTGVEDGETVAALVRAARCDLGVAALPLDTTDLVVEPWLHQDLLAVLPPGTELDGAAVGPLTDLRALAHLPVVLTPEGTSLRSMVEALYEAVGTALEVAVETNQRDALVPMVMHGTAMAFVTEELAEDARQRGAVVTSVLPSPRRSVGLLHRSGGLTPAARAFRDLVVRAGLVSVEPG